MKKNLLTLSFILAFSLPALLSQAQVGKGTHLVGGSVSFTSQTTKYNPASPEETNTYFSISPSWGKAIKQNFVVGGELAYGHENTKYNNAKGNSFGAGVFARQYHNIGTSGFYLFAEAALKARFYDATGRFHPNISTLDARRKTTTVSLRLQPGIAYAVTPRLHLETGLNNLFNIGYSHSETRLDGDLLQKQRAFNAGVSLANDFQWNIGFRFLLAGK